MRIAQLWIQNFRGIREARITFGSHTVFIGPNNCGKTTIIEALALLLGRDRMVRTLTEHDFHGSDPAAPDRIKLVATVIGFRGDEGDRTVASETIAAAKYRPSLQRRARLVPAPLFLDGLPVAIRWTPGPLHVRNLC